MGVGALMVAGAVVGGLAGLATGTMSTIANYQQNSAQEDMAKFNKRMAKRNAQQENINAASATARANAAAEAEAAEYARKEQLEREKNAKLRGYNLAVQGYSGMASDQGSSLLVNIDNAVNAELGALDIRRIGENAANNIRYEGELNAFQHRLNAAQYLGEAANYKIQQNSILSQRSWQLTGDIIGTVGSMLKGAAKGASMGAGLGSLLGSMGGSGGGTVTTAALNQTNFTKQPAGTSHWFELK